MSRSTNVTAAEPNGSTAIHINPAGSRALHACLPSHIWDAFVSTAGDPGGIGFLTEQLRELLVINGENPGDPAESSHAVDRITLRHLLLSELGEIVQFGKTFTHYQQHGDKVTAFFDDGSCATGDLLVGADGANSAVRRQFLPHAQRVPTEATATALRFPLTEQTRSWVPHRLASTMNMIVAPDPFFLYAVVALRGRSGNQACAWKARRLASVSIRRQHGPG